MDVIGSSLPSFYVELYHRLLLDIKLTKTNVKRETFSFYFGLLLVFLIELQQTSLLFANDFYLQIDFYS